MPRQAQSVCTMHGRLTWFDRLLARIARRRGFRLVPVARPSLTGWYFPPLREPTIRISWSDPQ